MLGIETGKGVLLHLNINIDQCLYDIGLLGFPLSRVQGAQGGVEYGDGKSVLSRLSLDLNQV